MSMIKIENQPNFNNKNKVERVTVSLDHTQTQNQSLTSIAISDIWLVSNNDMFMEFLLALWIH
jgi:hypothetical protein